MKKTFLIILIFIITLFPSVYSVTIKEEILMNVSNSTEFYRHYFNVQTLDDSLIINLNNIPRKCDEMKIKLEVYSTNSNKPEDFICSSIYEPFEYKPFCSISLKDLIQYQNHYNERHCYNQLKDLKDRELYFNIKIEDEDGNYHLELNSFKVIGENKFEELRKSFFNKIANILIIIGAFISIFLIILLKGKTRYWSVIPILLTIISQFIRFL